MADPLRESFDPRDPPLPVPGGIAARARPGGSGAAYLASLNPEQRLAVETLDGPVLVLAGAGTGKTRVLTVRIAHILATGRARPSEILAVTFTNKAAREMKARVSEIVGHVVEGMPWLGTFHSIGVKILRRHAELVGLKNDFTILDVDDQVRLLKQLLAAENIDEKRWPARVLASLIDGWKNRGLTPEQVPPGEAGVFANGKGLKLYKAFQERLKILNAADFGDLLLENIRLFREHPEVLRQYQVRFRFILVDEYQDTNVAQYLWLRLLGQSSSQPAAEGQSHAAERTDAATRQEAGPRTSDQSGTHASGGSAAVPGGGPAGAEPGAGAGAADAAGHRPDGRPANAAGSRERAPRGALISSASPSGGLLKNICCVGDDDQSIYGWRGAEVDNILRFEHDFPGAKVIRLERNYRSTGHILAAAAHIIAYNEGRLGKTLRTDDELGEKVAVTGAWDFRRGSARRRRGDRAIAARRARAQPDRHSGAGLISDARIRGPLRHARPALSRDRRPAFLRARRNSRRARVSADHQFAGRRSRLRAHCQCAETGLRRHHRAAAARHARKHRVPLIEAARATIATDELKPKSRGALRGLLNSLDRWRAQRDTLTHAELAETVLDKSGYTEMWQKDRSSDAAGRLENLKELVRSMEEFENLQGFLEHISLVMDDEKAAAEDAVSIMTLHSAKGLEFDTVFLPGWEEGVFPNQRTLDETGRAGLEEERRLAHVGITRARRRAKIYFATNRRMHGLWQTNIPSRFLDELPEDDVEVTNRKAVSAAMAATARPASTPRPRSARITRRPAGSARSKSATAAASTTTATLRL